LYNGQQNGETRLIMSVEIWKKMPKIEDQQRENELTTPLCLGENVVKVKKGRKKVDAPMSENTDLERLTKKETRDG